MSLNSCSFIGNLGADPEIKHTGTGTTVANFRIAVTEKWKGKDGHQQERTEWVRCVAFSKLAELCGKYLAKGRQVYVSGRMQTRDYDDKAGVKKYVTEIIVDKVEFLGGGKGERDRRDDGPPPPDGASAPASTFGPDEDVPFATCDVSAEPSPIASVLRRPV